MAGIVSGSLRPSAAARGRRRCAVALVASAALLTTAPGAPAHGRTGAGGCRGAHTSIMGARPDLMRRAVLCLINGERSAYGLPPLMASAKLDRAAQGWTDSMVASDDFTHGNAFMNRISATGFDWTTVGENIATGYESPATVVRAWMQSPGHCANILDPAYREVGTGLSPRRIPRASSRPGTWTQDFGRLMGQRALSGDEGPAQACSRR
jgi:uncharacterized protein YkwD